MCTVTYIPQKDAGFILSSNRDEHPSRAARELKMEKIRGTQVVFPRDAAAGGSWMAVATDGRAVVLLNGAFEKHLHCPPYKRSRGQMVLDFFSFDTPDDFARRYDFEGMEPFTFIVADGRHLTEMRWDESVLHCKMLQPGNFFIWSSATLYPGDIRAKRESWFQDWLSGRKDFSAEAIRLFHLSGGDADTWNGFVMNRDNRVCTVSFTQVIQLGEETSMFHRDLLYGHETYLRLHPTLPNR